MSHLIWPPKAPQAVLDYTIDYSKELADGEKIASATVSIIDTDTETTKLNIDDSDHGDDYVTVWLSAGTPSVEYVIKCLVVTDNTTPRTFDTRVTIRIME